MTANHGMRSTLPVRFTDARTVAMVDPSSGCAFGPIFDNVLEAEEFCSWCMDHHGDPRDIHEDKLNGLYLTWKEQQA